MDENTIFDKVHHQIAEMALARLYTLTGEKKYLDEAKYLLDYRGIWK